MEQIEELLTDLKLSIDYKEKFTNENPNSKHNFEELCNIYSIVSTNKSLNPDQITEEIAKQTYEMFSAKEDPMSEDESEDDLSDVEILDMNREIEVEPIKMKEKKEMDVTRFNDSKIKIEISSINNSEYFPYEKNSNYIKFDNLSFIPVNPMNIQDYYYRNIPMCFRYKNGNQFDEIQPFNTSKYKYKKDQRGHIQIVNSDEIYTVLDLYKSLWKCKDKVFQLLKLDGDDKRLYVDVKGTKFENYNIILTFSSIESKLKLFAGKFTVMFFDLNHDRPKSDLKNTRYPSKINFGHDKEGYNWVYNSMQNPELILKFYKFEGLVTECFVNHIGHNKITIFNSKRNIDFENYGEFKFLQDSFYKVGNKNTGMGSFFCNQDFLICLSLKW